MKRHMLWRPNSTWPPITEGITFLCDFRPGCGGVQPVYSAAGTTAPSTQTIDADGTRNCYGTIVQAVSNTARLEQYGVLIEPTRTNLGIKGHDFSVAATWVISNSTDLVVTNTAVTCKDGVSRTTNVIRCDVADGSIMQTVTSGSAAHSCGFWIKRIAGSGAVNITINGGSTWTAVTVTSDWTRVKRENITVTNPQFGIQMHVAGDQIALDFGQCEVGAALSSDIPTTTGSVQRTGDLLYYPTAGHFAASGGTVALLVQPGGTRDRFWTIRKATGGYLDCYESGGIYYFVSNSSGSCTSTVTPVSTGTVSMVCTWDSDGHLGFSVNKETLVMDEATTSMATLSDTLGIGAFVQTNANQSIANYPMVAGWNRPLGQSDADAVANWMLARVGAL